ncbi:MAG: ExbD/TolR family protein [Terriglobales bacterium]
MPLRQSSKIDVTGEINVTPLADVMLVLLIIFMVITPMLQKGLNVDMAKTVHPVPMKKANDTNAVIVGISHDGKIFLGNKIISLDQLTDSVGKLIAKRLDKEVYIKADARAQYVNVVDVVKAVRAAGVDKVGMLTQQVDIHGHLLTGGG